MCGRKSTLTQKHFRDTKLPFLPKSQNRTLRVKPKALTGHAALYHLGRLPYKVWLNTSLNYDSLVPDAAWALLRKVHAVTLANIPMSATLPTSTVHTKDPT